jgi:hypothetical protein
VGDNQIRKRHLRRGIAVRLLAAAAALFLASNRPRRRVGRRRDLSALVAGVVAALSYPLVLALFPEPVEEYGPTGHDVKGLTR